MAILYPELNLPNGKFYKALFGICRATGYGRNEQTGVFDEALYDPGDVDAVLAMKAHFDTILSSQILENPIVRIYLEEKRRFDIQAIEEPSF